MPPNVLLLILDSVRARNTSLHGHVRDTTPFLQRFAAETATCYEQARAPGARSITSHASIFTGLHVEEHGITSAAEKLKPGNTIFEVLRDEHGYATGVFSENVWITDVDIGLRDGFETVEGPQNVPFPGALDPRTFVAQEGAGQYRSYLRESFRGDGTLKSLANGLFIKLASDYPSLLPAITGSTPGSVYRDLFLDWVSERTGPWAACVNLMDAHGPYEPDEEHNRWGDEQLLDIEESSPDKWELHCSENDLWWRKEATESLYDGTIHQADTHAERIIEGLEDRGVLDDTLVVVTSDHGEGFGEPSRIRPNTRVAAHNVSVHEVLLHVPLIVKLPEQTQPERVQALSTLTRFPDVVRRAVDGTASPDDFARDSTVATTYGLTRDDQLRSRALRYCDESDLQPFDARARCAYVDNGDGTVDKHVTLGSEAATVLVRDAQTSYEVSDDGAAAVERAFDRIGDADVRTRGTGIEEMDEATYQRLEDLGYV